ncbi:hypothetical protein AL755_15445 [Arthrobacter sp. ERGS1:01]|uniref:hypothetical protein n=1 Tax=Arthrobacter sp. ERGS1:01 TaxID=1704044 RepID=UPI0006B66E40|nr:hypothetical protein [Arthrobacter sp. ERGS1:01]ALE06526.1 hypothetical protein AL755_15445 [Arthrobacter sp. ERGS1:01]
MTDPVQPEDSVPAVAALPPVKSPRPRWVVPLLIGVSAGAVAGAVVGATVVLPAFLDLHPIPPLASALASPSTAVTRAVSTSAPSAAAAAASPAAGSAKAFVSESAGFSAVFPGKATKATEAQLGAHVGNVQGFFGGDDIQSFTVQVLDQSCELSAAQAKSGMDQSSTMGVASAAKQIDATYDVLSETPRDLDGHHGLQTDFTLDMGTVTVTARTLVAYAGKHFYALQFASAQPDVPAWDAFINSFKSLDPDGTLPACTD